MSQDSSDEQAWVDNKGSREERHNHESDGEMEPGEAEGPDLEEGELEDGELEEEEIVEEPPAPPAKSTEERELEPLGRPTPSPSPEPRPAVTAIPSLLDMKISPPRMMTGNFGKNSSRWNKKQGGRRRYGGGDFEDEDEDSGDDALALARMKKQRKRKLDEKSQKYTSYADHDVLDDEGEDSDYSDRKWSGFGPSSKGRGRTAPARPVHNTDSSPSDYAALLAAATKTDIPAPGPYDSPLPTPPKLDDNPSEEEGELQKEKEPTEPPTQKEAPQKTERIEEVEVTVPEKPTEVTEGPASPPVPRKNKHPSRSPRSMGHEFDTEENEEHREREERQPEQSSSSGRLHRANRKEHSFRDRRPSPMSKKYSDRYAGNNDRGDRGDRERDRELRPPKRPRLIDTPYDERPVCKFFLDGKCAKGNDCQFNHNIHGVRLRKKPWLCKYYEDGHCSRGDDCIYYHQTWPCDQFHLDNNCPDGNACRYSHAELTDETRRLLPRMVCGVHYPRYNL